MLTLSNAIDEVYSEGLNQPGALEASLKMHPLPGTEITDPYDTALQAASYVYLGEAALAYHTIAQYASDLGVSLKPTVAPPTAIADFREFDPSASTATLQAAASTTVNADGAINAPSYDLTASTVTDELDTQTFTDQAARNAMLPTTRASRSPRSRSTTPAAPRMRSPTTMPATRPGAAASTATATPTRPAH